MAVAIGHDVLRKLAEAGVIPPHTRRVVLDVCMEDAVTMYVECYGDSKVIDLATNAFDNAVVIRTVDAKPDADKAPIRDVTNASSPAGFSEYMRPSPPPAPPPKTYR